MSINRVLLCKCGNSGVVPINIRTTIYKVLRINDKSTLYPLKNCQAGNLQNKLAEVNFIISDEISMVSIIVVLSGTSMVK